MMETITTINDLHQLRLHLLNFSTGQRPEVYQFQLPQLSDNENNLTGISMIKYSKDDGSYTSRIFTSIAFIVAIAYYFVSGGNIASAGTNKCISLAGIIISAAITGKIFGLIRARWKMLLLITLLITKTSNNMIIS